MNTPPASKPGKRFAEGRNLSSAERKLKRLRCAGLFGEDTKGATIRRACTASELRSAYALVHDVFLATGFLHPEPSGLRLRIFETSSETATFIAEKDGEVVGVISVVGDSPDLGLPSDAAFKPELDRLRATGLRLCELTNQAVSAAYRQCAVPTELMRCAVAHALQAGYHESVATVSPSHHGFYGLLGFGDLGSERSYSAKLHDPVIALRLDLDRYRRPAGALDGAAAFIRLFATENNPFMARVEGWGRSARRHFLNAELLEQLFVLPGNFLAARSEEERRILQRRWGRELFQVLGGGVDSEELAAPAVIGGHSIPPLPPAGDDPRRPAPSAPFWTPLRSRLAALFTVGEEASDPRIDPQQLWSYPSI